MGCRWRAGRRAAAGFRRHRQPRPDRGGGAGEGRRHLCAPRAVLARPGWPGDRLDEAAAGPAARARHQPVRLPPAAGCPSRAGQQRPARPQAGPAGERPLWRAGPRLPGCSVPMVAAMRSAQELALHVREGSWPARRLGRGSAARDQAGSPGAPAVPRAISKRRSPPAPMPSSRARSRSRKPTMRANAALPSWPAGTTRASAMALRPWLRMSRSSWAWSIEFIEIDNPA